MAFTSTMGSAFMGDIQVYGTSRREVYGCGDELLHCY